MYGKRFIWFLMDLFELMEYIGIAAIAGLVPPLGLFLLWLKDK
jgi:hypothetical protein